MAKQARIVDFEGARAASRSRTQSGKRNTARSSSGARKQARSSAPVRTRNSQSLNKKNTSAASRNSQRLTKSSARNQAKAPKIKKTSPKIARATQSTPSGIGAKLGSIKLGRKSTAGVLACVCVLACFAFLYNPVKNYYTAVREQAKAEVAYELVSTRNEALIEDVALLTSEAGMEDRVREQYGWVKEGENAVTVTGLSREAEPTPAEILRTITLNDIKAPETWYSPVLDPFFGYDNT